MKTKKLMILVLFLIILLIALTGCVNNVEKTESVNDESVVGEESINQGETDEPEIVVDGVLSENKKFMVGTINNPLEDEYEVKQYKNGDGINNEYIVKGKDVITSVEVKVSLEKDLEIAKTSILAKEKYKDADVSTKTIQDVEVTILKTVDTEGEYKYNNVLLFKKDDVLFEAVYMLNKEMPTEMGDYLIKEVVGKTEVYKK